MNGVCSKGSFDSLNQKKVRGLSVLGACAIFATSTIANAITLDKTYIINLDRSPARYEYTQQELLKNGYTDFERFSAIDGLKLKFTNIGTQESFYGIDVKEKRKAIDLGDTYRINCSKDFGFNYTNENNDLGAGSLGCSCSHLMVANEIVKNKYQYAMILEDDISITVPNFKEKFAEVLKEIDPEKCEAIYINYNWQGKLNLKRKAKIFVDEFAGENVKKLSRGRGMFLSNAAYILSNKAAKTILKYKNQKTHDPVDIMYSNLIEHRKIKGCYVTLYDVDGFNKKQHLIETEAIGVNTKVKGASDIAFGDLGK